MSLSQAVAAKRLLELSALISQRQREENFGGMLELVEGALADPEFALAEAQGRLLYHKAVALDLLGRSSEAFELLIRLVETFPGAPDMEQSLRVVCKGLEQRAQWILEENPNAKELFAIFHQLEKCSLPPYWLIHYVANHEAGSGQIEQAWNRIKTLLALSPNDADYLRVAISIAKACALHQERNALLMHVAELWEARPCRLDLAVLLAEEGVRLETPQAS